VSAVPRKPPANDNGTDDEPPRVFAPDGHPERTYARAGNLLLPLRFARRMPAWRDRHHAPGEREG
jgi:hypothetical protein